MTTRQAFNWAGTLLGVLGFAWAIAYNYLQHALLLSLLTAANLFLALVKWED